jgi:hypothetical protein
VREDEPSYPGASRDLRGFARGRVARFRGPRPFLVGKSGLVDEQVGTGRCFDGSLARTRRQ